MKILVVADIHGASYGADIITDAYVREKPDRVVVCGDVYGWHDSHFVNDCLSAIDVPLDVVRGNNDYVDDTLAPFVFEDYAVMHYFNRTLFFTHGHVYNMFHVPAILGENDVLVYGHTHTGGLFVRNGIIFANVGSVGRPRDGVRSYIIIDDTGITLKDSDGQAINGIKWEQPDNDKK